MIILFMVSCCAVAIMVRENPNDAIGLALLHVALVLLWVLTLGGNTGTISADINVAFHVTPAWAFCAASIFSIVLFTHRFLLWFLFEKTAKPINH